ncbi:MAG: ABC transporter ATP-binding protein [bacterium]
MRIDGLNLSRKAGSTRILDRASFSARAGECVGILGPSGSGKSTLISALCGLIKPDEGKVLIDGIDLYQNRSIYRKQIGLVPQEDIVHRFLPVEKALYYSALLRLPEEMDENSLRKRLEELLDTLGLKERRRTLIARLSGGERKRVNIALELITDPPLLFMDEPTSGLDPALERKFMELFRGLADGGRCVVLSTHVMDSVELLTAILILYRGRMVYYGPPRGALDYFGVREYAPLYRRLEDLPPEEWQQRYVTSSLCRDTLKKRLEELSSVVES